MRKSTVLTVLMQIQMAVIRSEIKTNQSLQKILDMPKSNNFGWIINKKKTTGELNNAKRPGRLRTTTVVDDRIMSMVKNPPPPLTKGPNRSKTLSSMQCLLYIKHCTQQNYTRYNCKMQITDKPEEQKCKRTVCYSLEQRWTCNQSDGSVEKMRMPTIRSTLVLCLYCCLQNRLVYDVTEDRSRTISFEGYRTIWS